MNIQNTLASARVPHWERTAKQAVAAPSNSDFLSAMQTTKSKDNSTQGSATYSLTEEQISDLKSRYDIEGLSREELDKLLGELADSGVIEQGDTRTFGARPIVVGAFPRFENQNQSFTSGNALDWLSSGISEYGALLRWMGVDENAGYLDSDYSLENASNERNVANFKSRLENLRDVLVKLK